jgi:hypothetical protein
MSLKVFTCTDHKGHWPVGVASVVIAANETEARRLLDIALLEEGLDVDEYSLREIPANEPRAVVLNNGEY